jgi:hypothetical protein
MGREFHPAPGHLAERVGIRPGAPKPSVALGERFRQLVLPRLVEPPVEHLDHVDMRSQHLSMATVPTLPSGIWVG